MLRVEVQRTADVVEFTFIAHKAVSDFTSIAQPNPKIDDAECGKEKTA
jgi:hypothetical protein